MTHRSPESPYARSAWVVTVPLLVALLVAGCSAPEARTLPPPSSTSSTDPAPTTSEPDLSVVSLDTVPGRPTTTLPTTGDATLTGVVAGPDGAVASAIVLVERLVADAVQSVELFSGEDGRWSIAGLPGGRFRVRAFLPPTLTMLEPKVFYLADGGTQDIPLVMSLFTGLDVASDTAPDAPVVGDAVNLSVRVTDRVVDDRGVGRRLPVTNVPIRIDSSGWVERGDTFDVTDGRGTVTFAFACDRVTQVTAQAVVGTDREPFRLEVPSCSPRPTTTTTTTTTTIPDGTTSSTSTTTQP